MNNFRTPKEFSYFGNNFRTLREFSYLQHPSRNFRTESTILEKGEQN